MASCGAKEPPQRKYIKPLNSEVWEMKDKQPRKLEALEMDALGSCRISNIYQIR